MKNPLQEILNAGGTTRVSSTLDPKEAGLLPPLLEQRSSLLGRPPVNKPIGKRPALNNSEPKLRKEPPELNSLAPHYIF
jgi:hypothetical protein